MTANKTINIISGGTVAHISSHLALSAPAYGSTGERLSELCKDRFKGKADTWLFKTKMAGGSALETNEDIKDLTDGLVNESSTMIIFFNCAIVDFKPIFISSESGKIGKYEDRLKSSRNYDLEIKPDNKIIQSIRKKRKDIYLVGFKTTCGATEQEMFERGLNLLKTSHVNLVLVNDVKTRLNMIVTPEEATYCVTQDREKALKELVDISYYRSQLKFTQSRVVEGRPVKWSQEKIPSSLFQAVNYCIQKGAYKTFNGSTVGHFAHKISDNEFLTSIRRSNFNNLEKEGLVYVKTSGPDTVLAYGAKPSVGGQSQRIVFNDHPGMDCILHFHCPMKANRKDDIEVRSQREVECGSHECGENTSNGLKQFGNLKAVMLDNHGPNIVFNQDIDPQEVIQFIYDNFDLSKKTGGYKL